VRVSSCETSSYRSRQISETLFYDRLVESGYYIQRPDKALANSIGIAVGVAFVLGSLTILSIGRGRSILFAPGAMIAAAVLSTGILLIFAVIMPARTVEGGRAREASLGFKEFLSRVEEDRYKRLITSPELFEKFLPYAMAFGVADRWANAFKDIYREPPQWYSGGTGPFNARASHHRHHVTGRSEQHVVEPSSSDREAGFGRRAEVGAERF
jgi:hypothetical protein